MSDWKEQAQKVLSLCKPEYKYIAMDQDGEWFVYVRNVYISERKIMWTGEFGQHVGFLNIPPAPNWKESLIERKQNNE